MDLSNSIPQVLLEDEDYRIFLSLINQISTDIHDLIKEVPNLVDINNVPEIFLPKLATLVRYNLRTDLDINYQREVIKRLIDIYKSRGSNDEIIMAATYGDYDRWVGSHVFYPDADIDRQRAKIIYPIDELFRHSKSKFSGYDKYPGGSSYREGTIIIQLGYVNDRIRNAIKKVVPAGIKIYYELLVGLGDKQGFIVDYGEWTIDPETTLLIELRDANSIIKPARRSSPSGARSSVFCFSGTKGYITEFFVPFLGIEAFHSDYQAALVSDKYVGDSLDYEILDLEISIYKDE